MRKMIKFPPNIVEDLRLTHESFIVLCYILSELKEDDEFMILSKSVCVSEMMGVENKPGTTSRLQRAKIEKGLLRLAELEYVYIEKDYMGFRGSYKVIPNARLKEVSQKGFRDVYEGVVDMNVVTDILKTDQKEFKCHKKRVLRAYLYVATHTFTFENLPSRFKGKFYTGGDYSLGKILSPTRVPLKKMEMGIKLLKDLCEHGYLKRYPLPKRIYMYNDWSIRSIYYLKTTDEEADDFYGWINANRKQTGKAIAERKDLAAAYRKPKFKFRDELYKGYPAKLIYEYKGKDEDFLALREEMIEEWTL